MEKIANHSARKTSLTNLLGANVNPLHVQQISGHKKIESLNVYHQATLRQQKQMSNIISGKNNCSTTTLSSISHPSTNETSIPLEIQQQLSQSWNPVTPIFQGATISNCTFNIHVNSSNSSSPVRKRRRIIIEDSQE